MTFCILHFLKKIHIKSCYLIINLVAWLFVLYVPSRARSFRDGTPIYCPLRRTRSSVFTPFPLGIESQGRSVAVHYTTAAARQLHDVNLD